MLEEIKKWTREDWKMFDNYRYIAFSPTPEEIRELEKQKIDWLIYQSQQYLALYNISFNWTESDFTELYTSYIKWDWTSNNWDMKQWIWKEDILNETLQYRINNHNNIIDFCQFIIQYEQ